MRIFYFIHITGTDSGISGVPRVVRNLARELASRPDIDAHSRVLEREPAERSFTQSNAFWITCHAVAARRFEELSLSLRAISPEEEDWLLIPEVPHLQSHLSDYAPVLID